MYLRTPGFHAAAQSAHGKQQKNSHMNYLSWQDFGFININFLIKREPTTPNIIQNCPSILDKTEILLLEKFPTILCNQNFCKIVYLIQRCPLAANSSTTLCRAQQPTIAGIGKFCPKISYLFLFQETDTSLEIQISGPVCI